MIKILQVTILTSLFSSAYSQTIQGVNQLSIELTKELYSKGNNLFCSPLSLSTALAMTYAGAEGNTKAQFEKIMHYPEGKTFEGFSEIDKLIEKINKKGDAELLLANALWNGIKLKENYQNRLKNEFSAEYFTLNGAEEINKWADKNTKGKIPKIVSPSDITPEMALVLTNAIYFKGDWADKFIKKDTKKEWFYPAKGKKTKTSMMSSKRHVEYLENNTYQTIRLPYKGNDLYMEVFLPLKGISMEKLLESINPNSLSFYSVEEVKITIPKFKLETTYNLIPSMKNLGLELPFTKPDFSGIADIPLVISLLKQKAFIEVDEEGTEAAAVTVVGMTTTSSITPIKREPKIFKADRPFFFVIKTRKDNLILFSGIIEQVNLE